MNHELNEILKNILPLAQHAGEEIKKYFKGRQYEVDRKPGNEPVTDADRASEAIIINGIHQHWGTADGILSEENSDKSSWSQYRRAWVIDPLDGTKDFIAGRPGFSVMIGLLQDFRPVLGVVHQPLSDLTFYATLGGGAFWLRGEERIPLHVSPCCDLPKLRLVASHSNRTAIIDEVKRALGIMDEQNIGSVGTKVSLVARGERDIYLNPTRHCRLWDVCAPEIILSEAGGKITDLFGQPIQYQPQHLQLERGFLASNGVCHDAVLEAIRPIPFGF